MEDTKTVNYSAKQLRVVNHRLLLNQGDKVTLFEELPLGNTTSIDVEVELEGSKIIDFQIMDSKTFIYVTFEGLLGIYTYKG